MRTFVETIKVLDGRFYNLSYHEKRLRETSRAVFGYPALWNVFSMKVPDASREGLVKCRIVYDREIRDITFQPYHFRQIGSLQLVDGGSLDYRFKATDRTGLSILAEQRGACDEVLIVKDGMITDTSFSNVVLEDETGFYTPDTYLLNGTCRQRLLAEGVIRERAVPVGELYRYNRVYLINAMMGLEDGVSLGVGAVRR